MKFLLVAINGKFIHSSLSIRCLSEYCSDFKDYIHTSEYTINQHLDDILFDIVKQNPDYLGFSCYIWNIEIVTKLSVMIKQVLPDTIIFLGGPEASYNKNILSTTNSDIVIIGEGEETLKNLINLAVDNKKIALLENLQLISGISYKFKDVIYHNEIKPFDFAKSIFPYKSNFDNLNHKIIYYEASRGCPFSCGYCISSIDEKVRFLPIERVLQELGFFLDKKVRQVKFVDRTFNCNIPFATKIWEYLIKNTNNYTNFHFEIAADLLNDNMLELLKSAPKGLFQLEIGVQSTNKECLETIRRKSNLEKLFVNVEKLQSYDNMDLHLDLIAGLPTEDYNSFKKSFNDVYKLKVDQFQLGFLKLLHGSYLRENAEKLGLVYRIDPPYEILYTKEISFDEIMMLKGIEEMLSLYYNSGKFKNVFLYLENLPEITDYFSLYENLWLYYVENKLNNLAHNKENTYKFLFDFACHNYNVNKKLLSELILLDMLSNENLKNIPIWLNIEENSANYTILIDKFYHKITYNNEYLANLNDLSSGKRRKKSNLRKFNYNVIDKVNLHENVTTWILFIYDKNIEIIKLEIGEIVD